MLATHLLRKDPRAAMEQGGWLDIRSVIGYAQDVPENRRQLVVDMDEVAAASDRSLGKGEVDSSIQSGSTRKNP